MRALEKLQLRHSSKWRRYPADVLPMHVAEMDFDVAQPITDVIIDMAKHSDLGYLGPVPELGEAFAGFASRRWGWSLDAAQVKPATDVGVAAIEILRAISGPGQRLLINTPVYSSFSKWITELKMLPHDVPLVRQENSWMLDLDGIEEAFRDGVKVFLLCNPQNPVGRVHTRAELTKLAGLARQYGATVISDEIHAPLVYSKDKFVPYLSLGEDAHETGITITSSSKAWNTAGLKAAIVITQSDTQQKALLALPESMHWRASLIGAYAMVASYELGEQWLDDTVTQIQANLRALRAELGRQLPGVQVAEAEATYLSWLDVSSLGLQEPAAQILARGRLALVPGPDNGPDPLLYGQFVRLNFGCLPEFIPEAVNRIVKSL